jgi:hypothetical protein
MNVPIEEKLAFVSEALAIYTSRFDVVDMRSHADDVRGMLTAAEPQTEPVL